MTTQSLYDDTVTSQDFYDTTTDLPMESKEDFEALALTEILVEEFVPEAGLEQTDEDRNIEESEEDYEYEYVEEEEEEKEKVQYTGESM